MQYLFKDLGTYGIPLFPLLINYITIYSITITVQWRGFYCLFPWIWIHSFSSRLIIYNHGNSAQSTLIFRWRQKSRFMPFPRALVQNECKLPQLELELGWSILFFVLITIYTMCPIWKNYKKFISSTFSLFNIYLKCLKLILLQKICSFCKLVNAYEEYEVSKFIDNSFFLFNFHQIGPSGNNVLVYFKLRPDIITPDNLHQNICVSSMLDSPVSTLYHVIQKIYAPIFLEGSRWSQKVDPQLQNLLSELEMGLGSAVRKLTSVKSSEKSEILSEDSFGGKSILFEQIAHHLEFFYLTKIIH